MAVPVTLDPTFQPGPPSKLFQVSVARQFLPFGHQYAVSDDGQRFLVASAPNAAAAAGDSTPITVVVNWTTALHKK